MRPESDKHPQTLRALLRAEKEAEGIGHQSVAVQYEGAELSEAR